MPKEDLTPARSLNGRDALDEIRTQGPADMLARLGAAFTILGRAEDAVGFYQQAIERYRANQDRRGEAVALSSLGHAHWQRGETPQALDAYHLAAALYRLVNQPVHEAMALN